MGYSVKLRYKIEIINKHKIIVLDWLVKNKKTKNTHYNKNNTCK
jgi:hypothetical protein